MPNSLAKVAKGGSPVMARKATRNSQAVSGSRRSAPETEGTSLLP